MSTASASTTTDGRAPTGISAARSAIDTTPIDTTPTRTAPIGTTTRRSTMSLVNEALARARSRRLAERVSAALTRAKLPPHLVITDRDRGDLL